MMSDVEDDDKLSELPSSDPFRTAEIQQVSNNVTTLQSSHVRKRLLICKLWAVVPYFDFPKWRSHCNTYQVRQTNGSFSPSVAHIMCIIWCCFWVHDKSAPALLGLWKLHWKSMNVWLKGVSEKVHIHFTPISLDSCQEGESLIPFLFSAKCRKRFWKGIENYMDIVDLGKAFDRVPREMLYWSLEGNY